MGNKVTSRRISSPAFLSGGGPTGELIRAFDWAETALGPPADWPVPLRTVLGIVLATNHPGFIFWGPQAICLYNEAYSRSLGPEKHPSILGAAGEQAWPEIWSIIGPQIHQVMSGGEATWHENQLVPIMRRGSIEDVYWTYGYSPIRDESAPNGVGGVLVLCTETTEQVLAAERLEQAQAQWRSWFHQAPGFMCIVKGPDHTFEFANPGYVALFGDVVGKSVAQALPWALDQGFIELLDEVLESGEPYTARAAPVAIPQGDADGIQHLYLDFVFQPIRDDRGSFIGVFVIGSDVTERRLAEQRRDEFLATLSHELRNPLAPIANAVQMLKLKGSDPTISAKATELIDRQLQSLVRLIDDLLDVVRVSRGRIELRKSAIVLNDVIGHAVETAMPHAELAHCTVELRLLEEPVVLMGDGMRLGQVFQNLLINACKYSDAGSTIVVATER
ncbi:MAG: PAS domain-containing protein, partial [Burkholderiaceae bacterium]